MISQEKMRQIADYIMNVSRAEQAEVMVVSSDYTFTRFANNTIHQNIATSDCRVFLRVVHKKRIASVLGNKLKKSDLKALCVRALKIARAREKDEDFVSLPSPTEIEKIDSYDEKTASLKPRQTAGIVKDIIKRAKRDGSTAAGSLSISAAGILTANSLGISASHDSTFADLNVAVSNENGAGYAVASSRKIDDLDFKAAAERACDKCIRSKNPVELQPGNYTVVLEPLAVITLIQFLAYLGFSARTYQENRSFMSGKLGQKITGGAVTIFDDGISREGFPEPFDAEGTGKKKVVLIEKGVARNVVYDSYTAARENKKSTGHATPAFYNAGPFPSNLFMEAGEADAWNMMASADKAILVTRFHYTNIVEPMSTLITGMTRDGTFLIEGGRITRPIKNLRFTQSILEALKNADMISKERLRFASEGGTYVVPAVRIRDFHFSGKTR